MITWLFLGFARAAFTPCERQKPTCLGKKNERVGVGGKMEAGSMGKWQGRGGTEPHLKREASKATKGLGGLVCRDGDPACLERSESVAKEKLAGGREKMMVWEGGTPDERGHRGDPSRAGGELALNGKPTSPRENCLQDMALVGAGSSHLTAPIFVEDECICLQSIITGVPGNT